MFEVYYMAPRDFSHDAQIATEVERFGGEITFTEEPDGSEFSCQSVVLTCEFADLAVAERAADAIRNRGEHVEGPMDYGD